MCLIGEIKLCANLTFGSRTVGTQLRYPLKDYCVVNSRYVVYMAMLVMHNLKES